MPWTLSKRDHPLRLISTSDWHLGNQRVPASLICDRLYRYFFDQIPGTQLINIGGDVWDSLLSLGSETNGITALIIDFLRLCHEHNVVVRVLLGTFTHDRGQSKLFEIYHKKCQFTNDVRYIDTLCLEEITALNCRVLYIPDDLPYSAEECLEIVTRLMRDRNWDYVDYVFGHGYFDQVLPPHIPRKPKCTFTVEQFKPFVRRYVCMGHVHLNNLTGNVFYNNSFDRLAHGEEEPKGFMVIEDDGVDARLQFVENVEATKFVTLNLSDMHDKEAIGPYYLQALRRIFAGNAGYIRINHPSSEIRQSLQQLTSSHHPELKFSFKKLATGEATPTSIKTSFVVSEFPTPNAQTLPKMVYDFLQAKDRNISLTCDDISVMLSQLK